MKFRIAQVALLLTVALVTLTPFRALAQSLSVSTSPTSLTIHPGDTNVPVTVTLGSSLYTGPVNIVVTGLPTGVTASPSPLVLSPGGSGTIE